MYYNVSYFKRNALVLLTVIMLSPLMGLSQANMLFCFNNDENSGEPDWPFTTISFANDKSVRCMVYLTAPLENGEFVTFNVSYRKSAEDTFSESHGYKLMLQPEWSWFFYKFTFKLIGEYKVELLDSKDKPIVEKVLHLVE